MSHNNVPEFYMWSFLQALLYCSYAQRLSHGIVHAINQDAKFENMLPV